MLKICTTDLKAYENKGLIMENITKNYIDDYLSNNTDLKLEIISLSYKYNLSDFILITPELNENFIYNNKSVNKLSGVLLQPRIGHFRIDVKSFEERLTREYISFILHIINNREVVDKVYYIVAYHVLCLGKHYGYILTEANNCPFPADPIGGAYPLAKKRLNQWNTDELYIFKDFASFFYEEDALFFNSIYNDFGEHFHSTKHFSLIKDLIDIEIFINKRTYLKLSGLLLDNFTFNYKVIFTSREISIYTTKEEFDKIHNELISNNDWIIKSKDL